MLRLGFMAPLFLLSYLDYRSRKAVYRLRRRFASQE